MNLPPPMLQSASGSTMFGTMFAVRLVASKHSPTIQRPVLCPEPCAYCGKCDWSATCDDHWRKVDHLCRVADITRKQRQKLVNAGVSTAALLGSLNGQRIARNSSRYLARLVQQARLQRQSSQAGIGVHELLPHSSGLGFDRLPPPHPDDLFFDFEGDPMHPGGLEYLCGVLWQAAAGDEAGEPVPGHPDFVS